ncbi:unnamed protein product, partial [Amoebophrya sp. A25]|eukprot:GSA25T00016563001.1
MACHLALAATNRKRRCNELESSDAPRKRNSLARIVNHVVLVQVVNGTCCIFVAVLGQALLQEQLVARAQHHGLVVL